MVKTDDSFQKNAYWVYNFQGQNKFTKTNVSTLTVFKHCQEHLKSKWRVERMHIEPYTIHDESEQFFVPEQDRQY